MLPREKLYQRGVQSLTYTDLISVLISSGVKGRDFHQLAKEVYQRLKGEIDSKRDLDIHTLKGIKGIGSVKSMQILCGIELGRRLFEVNIEQEKRVIVNTEKAYEEIRSISKFKQERLVAVYLNARFEILSKKTIAIGTINRVNTDNREIVSPALNSGCAYVIIAHNHPSGDPTPSNEDITFTKELNKALNIFGITLLEHIIVSHNDWRRVDIF